MHRVNISSLRPFDTEKLLGWIVSAFAFLFPVTVLAVNRADSVILFMLGMIGIYAFLCHGVRGLALDRRALIMMGLFAGWYAVIVLCYFVGDKTDTGFKLLGRNLRLLFFIPAFIACRRYLKNVKPLLSGLALAPFAVLCLGLWQFLHAHGHIRVSGYIDPIPFGDLSMAMAFMALAFLQTENILRPRWGNFLAGAALASGVAASIFSGTRGSWVALPVLLLFTVLILSRRSRIRGLKVFVVCCIVVFSAGLLVPKSIVYDRTNEAIKNFNNYLVYLKLIKEGDVERRGCLNPPIFMKQLADTLQVHYAKTLTTTVINDASELKSAGFLNQCQSGDVLEIRNNDRHKNTTMAISRTVVVPNGHQSATFIIRGRGMASIRYASPPAWKEFNNVKYAVVEWAQNVDRLSWPAFRLPAGGAIYILPVQNSVGEYVFPYANNSIGARLEMWRTAWHIFKDYPLLGSGTGSFMQETDKRVLAGDVSPAVKSYDHPHNDYMNAMASWGLLGLAFYLLVMGYPLTLFARALHSGTKEKRAASFAGVLMVSGLLVFGLTETMFTHSIVLSWYVTFTAMFAAIIFRPDDGKSDVEP